jgi:UDP-N-acetylmuramoylalanine--D-glutamate ligase
VRVIGITGSNGKTTTTTLIGELCAAAGKTVLVAGNIGTHVLDALSDIERAGVWPECVVLELSSFQLEATSRLRCMSATILNICEDHLDRYASLFDYAATKATLFAQTQLQVINRDDPLVKSMRRFDVDAVSFGGDVPLENQWGIRNGHLIGGNGFSIPAAQIGLFGHHNHMNVLAALACVGPLNIPQDRCAQVLARFNGLPHRMERIAQRNGVTYIDDSKGTNVGAVVAALEGVSQPVVLIAGGDGKGQDFSPLRAAINARARAVLLIGRDANKIESALQGCTAPISHCASLESAVAQAAALAQPGDLVLLSPACASLDMFRNYAHRSEVFVKAVASLGTGVMA